MTSPILAPSQPEELRQVEKIVNAKIYDALPVVTRVMPIREAKALGRHGAVRRKIRR